MHIRGIHTRSMAPFSMSSLQRNALIVSQPATLINVLLYAGQTTVRDFSILLALDRTALLPLECLVVLLEAGHDAEVGLAVGAVVLGLPPQDAAVRVRRVPAVVAAQGGSLARLRAVSELVRGRDH